jgi:hypothetical protein
MYHLSKTTPFFKNHLQLKNNAYLLKTSFNIFIFLFFVGMGFRCYFLTLKNFGQRQKKNPVIFNFCTKFCILAHCEDFGEVRTTLSPGFLAVCTFCVCDK